MHQSLSVTASTCEPLTCDEAKVWLRLSEDQAGDEPILDTLITAARRKVEAITGRLFYQSTCALYLDGFPADSTGVVKVPVVPLVSVASITSYALDDTATVMSTSDYTVDTVSEPGRIGLASGGSWPTSLRDHNSAVVSLTAGYSTSTGSGSTGVSADCQPMVSAVKLLVAHWYENRQSVVLGGSFQASTLVPLGVEYLLSELRSPEVDG
jgi:uncharacterized phiE125 gp8 family phage protein